MRKQFRVSTGKSRLHIRSGPSISYKIVGYLYNGNTVIVDEMKTASNGQVWYRIEKTTKWIAKNDPVTKEDNYLKLVKDLEEDTPKTEKVEDEPIDESKPKAPPLPSKKENNKNEYKINKNMEGETILKYGEDDTTNLGSKMKPFSSSSSSNGVSINEQVEGVYIKNIKDTTNSDMIKIRKNFSIGNPDRRSGTDSVINQMFTQFNRWNFAFPDYHLARTHTKIFFTRPDLNIMTSSTDMHTQAKKDPFYNYIYENQPNVIKYLTKYASSKHQFNPMISNNPKSFEISDEYIKTVEAGETYTGYKVFYGRNDIESKAAGEISINYIDDRNLDIYKMHKVWVDYISKVYRGEFSPKTKYKHNKTLDYAVAVYYFLLAQDGETILFWSKFTGVFPTNTSSSTFSWDKDTMTKMPEISIKYVYSFKRDLDPAHLAEFNTLSSEYNASNALRSYEPSLLGMGPTWSGAPFVVTGKNGKGNTIYKLKFRPTS